MKDYQKPTAIYVELETEATNSNSGAVGGETGTVSNTYFN